MPPIVTSKFAIVQFTPFDLERVISVFIAQHNYDGPIHLEMIGDDLDKPEILGQAREHLAGRSLKKFRERAV